MAHVKALNTAKNKSVDEGPESPHHTPITGRGRNGGTSDEDDFASLPVINVTSLNPRNDVDIASTSAASNLSGDDEDYTPNYAELDDDADYVYSGSRNPSTKPPPSTMSMATTTPLVRHIFECFFKNQGRIQ